MNRYCIYIEKNKMRDKYNIFNKVMVGILFISTWRNRLSGCYPPSVPRRGDNECFRFYQRKKGEDLNYV